MILLVCVLLLMTSVGLVFGPDVLVLLADLRLRLSGWRVRVPARRMACYGDRRLAFPSRQGGPPPVRVHTRIRPMPPCPTPVPPHG